MGAALWILFLAFFQNVSFSIVSRARNRSSWTYHLIASVFSNTIWFLTFRQLVLGAMNFFLFMPYTLGTVTGSLTGASFSMWIESKLNAASDTHIKMPAFITKKELDETLAPILKQVSELIQVRSLKPAFDFSARSLPGLKERTAIVQFLSPPIPKSRAARRWTSFERAGQMRLALEG